MKTFLAQNQFTTSVDGSPPSPTENSAVAPSPGKGDAAADLTSDIPEVFRVANYLCAEARRFVPDYEGILFAMQDETAPRLRADDPVWADEAPLFLRMTS